MDIVVDESYYFSGLAGLNLANFTADYGFNTTDATTLKFLANKAVFRFDGLVSEAEGLDWFETAVARPDLVGGPACCVRCGGVQGVQGSSAAAHGAAAGLQCHGAAAGLPGRIALAAFLRLQS